MTYLTDREQELMKLLDIRPTDKVLDHDCGSHDEVTERVLNHLNEVDEDDDSAEPTNTPDPQKDLEPVQDRGTLD